MLEKLTIRFFQKHQSITIDFNPQITTLWGRTDAGKSAIIRALRWLMLNKRPTNHINWDSTWAKVTLVVDGNTIIRKQTGQENFYILNGKKFKSFNKGVPKPIAEILNVSDVNFQRQHEQHFWIALSSGQLSKELNQIVDLSVIDSSLSKAASQLRKANTQIEVSKQRIEETKLSLQSLRWVKKADRKLREIESLQEDLTDLYEGATGIRLLLTKLQRVQTTLDELEEPLTEGRELLVLGSQLQKLRKQHDGLDQLVATAHKAIQIRKIEIPNITELEELVQKRDGLLTIIHGLEDLGRWEQSRNERLITLQRILKKQRVCPVCGAPLSQYAAETCTLVTNHQSQGV